MGTRGPNFKLGQFNGCIYNDWTVTNFINVQNTYARCKCGHEQRVRLSDLKSGQTKACYKCYNKRRYQDIVGKKFHFLTVLRPIHSGRYGHKWECKCDCGMIKIVGKKDLVSGSTKSCGCWRQKQMMNNMLSYNPNLTEEERRIRRTRSSKWSTEIKKRDRYSCQKCGFHAKKNLVAHHIKAYWKYPDVRWDLDNGITLCKSCHKMFHKTFGWEYFNPEDTNKFLQCIQPQATAVL